MARYTERDCKAAVVRLASSLGVAVLGHDKATRDLAERIGAKVARFVDGAGVRGGVGATEDCIYLDYNPTYGGAIVEFTEKGHTGTWNKFGGSRLSPADFCTAIEMMRSALDFAERFAGSK